MPLRSVRWKSGRGFDKLDSDKPPVIEEVALARQVHANCIRPWIEFSAWMAAPAQRIPWRVGQGFGCILFLDVPSHDRLLSHSPSSSHISLVKTGELISPVAAMMRVILGPGCGTMRW